MVPQHEVVQLVVGVLYSRGERRGHEQEVVEVVGVLGSAHNREVFGLPVSVRVLSGSIVGFTSYVLEGRVHVQAVFVVL